MPRLLGAPRFSVFPTNLAGSRVLWRSVSNRLKKRVSPVKAEKQLSEY
jgi:hypothetical protein